MVDKKIDQLNSEVSDLDKLLKELKTTTFSETERKKKELELKDKADKLQEQLDKLSSEQLIDEQIKSLKYKGDVLLKSCADTLNLQDSIQNKKESINQSASTGVEAKEPEEETKNRRSKFPKRGKWALWAIWATVAWTWLYKKFFWKKKVEKENGWWKWDEEKESNKKEKWEKKESSSRWKKFFVWTSLAAWTVVWWVELYKHRNRISSRCKEKLWLALSFDEAIQKVEAEVRNWKIDDNHFWVFKAHFEGWIKYDENTEEICSYWQKTKIEKNWKKLQWMENVEFSSWEELIHAANIVNFAKRMLRWRGDSATPFWVTSWWGDIAFNCSAKWKQEFLSASNSNEWSWILWTLWTIWWWILWGYCAWAHWAAIWVAWWWTWWYALWAYIDNSSTAGRCCETISRGKNFDEFINYLNRQTDENWKSLWESAWEQHIDPNETPINPVVDNWKEWSEWKWVLEEIENTYWEDQSWRRNLQIERDPSNPTEYKIKSYNHELKMIVEWLPTKNWEKIDYSKIKKIHIEKYEEYDCRWDGLDIDFPHTEEGLKEAIKTANLTNMIVEDRKWKGGEAYPFAYGKYISKGNGLRLDLDIDTPGRQWWTCVLWNNMLKERFPSIHKDLEDSKTLSTSQKYWHDQAVQDKSEWSQYIKFLHQIGKWHFWKKQ